MNKNITDLLMLRPGTLPSSPVEGLFASDSGDSNKPKFYQGGGWIDLSAAGSGLSNINREAFTSADTLDGANDFAICNASSGAFTLTLPAGTAGQRYIIKKDRGDSSLNAVTIAADGSETINGSATTTLNTFGETLHLIFDGTSNWEILSRHIPSEWVSYNLQISAATVAPTKGTVAVDEARWRRVGDSLQIRYVYEQTGAGDAGTGDYRFPFPNGGASPELSMDTAKLALNSSIVRPIVGHGITEVGGTTRGDCILTMTANASFFSVSSQTAINTFAAVSSTNFNLGSADTKYAFETGLIPISGWNS